MRGLFITGTDTGVGKTVACAALMHRYRDHAPLCYWKPIQTGSDDDTVTVRRLAVCRDDEIFDEGVRLPEPLSPHTAAELAGTRIDLPSLRDARPADERTGWIVEGAGGVLVPVNEIHLMADWMVMLELPVLIVARSRLGTINHTLLTLEALRARWIKAVGVFMVGDLIPANRAAIERYGGVPVLGEMPFFNPLTPDAIAAWSAANLDRKDILAPFLAPHTP